MKQIISIISLLVAPLISFADGPNLPDLGGQTQIGRVLLFKTPVGTSWLAPTAFSSRFTCTGSSDNATSRSCVLRIFNNLNDDELSQMNALTRNEGLQITHFTDIESYVVSNITEDLQDAPEFSQAQKMFTRSLRLTGSKLPYAQALTRTDGSGAERMLQKYSHSGLGRYLVKFDMRAQETTGYIGIRDGVCMKQRLLSVQGRSLDYREIRALADAIGSSCGARAVGLDQDDAAMTIKYELKARFFKWTGRTKYQLDPSALDSIQGSYVFAKISSPPTVVRCQSVLELKEGAVPITTCSTFQDGNR